AGPAAALGIGAVGGACDGGFNLVGEDRDAADTTTDDTSICADYALTSPVPVGDCYVRYLTEAEGRALIGDLVREETANPSDPCEHPTLHERLMTDLPFPIGAGSDDALGRIDLLAPAISVEWAPPCLGGYRPAIGFEFMTDEARDDEDVTGNAEGLTDAEEAFLGALRERREAGIAPIHATDHPYGVLEYIDGRIDDSDRARAEDLLRATVRAMLDDLRRDGMI
ncbi:MAG: hypothetical protein QME96_16230, partial [Myxococcota bacterium]|nr:hypothetical protein [Myxococcota bacterium]